MNSPFKAMSIDPRLADRINSAVDAHAEDAFSFLERLVAAPSTVGNEAKAQSLVGDELNRLGLSVTEVPIPNEIGGDPIAGVPSLSYDRRSNVFATTAPGELALLINGHIDVVPADPSGWRTPPWSPQRSEGWMFGRGAGDMKGGFAMTMLALEALHSASRSVLDLPLGMLSAIEEECTGNGTLAALRQGIVADLVILPEPTDLGLLVGGTGIVWVDITLQGSGGHAESADRVVHALDVALRIVPALEEMGRRVAKETDDVRFGDLSEPYNVNVGFVNAGDWRSSVASVVTLGVRFGHPRQWTAERAISEIQSVVSATVKEFQDGADSGVNVSISPTGFKAQGYLLDAHSSLALALAQTHCAVHGSVPATFVGGSTTDARFYINQAGSQALCYGPVARQIHGVDEAVELSSIVDGAKTLAQFIAGLAGRTGKAMSSSAVTKPGSLAEPIPSRMALRPVSARTAGEQVADRLVTAIALGQFLVGERLPSERELASMLDVSRTTVREGVGTLVATGYVSVRRGRYGGIFVQSAWRNDAASIIRRTLIADWARLQPLFDRSLIESEIARVAAMRRSARDVVAIEEALRAYVNSPNDRRSSQLADQRLHQVIAASTGNPYLVELVSKFEATSVLAWARSRGVRAGGRGLQQHPELVNAVIEGDPARAGAFAAEHFSLTEHTIRDLFNAVDGTDDLQNLTNPIGAHHANHRR